MARERFTLDRVNRDLAWADEMAARAKAKNAAINNAHAKEIKEIGTAYEDRIAGIREHNRRSVEEARMLGRKEAFDEIRNRTKSDKGTFEVGGVKRGRALSREVFPQSTRTPGANLTDRELARHNNAQVARTLQAESDWKRKTDEASRRSELLYLLNGNRAQRMRGQQILEEQRLAARNKMAEDERAFNERLLEREQQGKIDLQRTINEGNLGVANIDAKKQIDLADVNARTQLGVAAINAKSQSDVAIINAYNNKEIAGINAASASDVAQTTADANAKVAAINAKGNMNVAKTNADANMQVAKMNAEAQEAQALAASFAQSQVQAGVGVDYKLALDIAKTISAVGKDDQEAQAKLIENLTLLGKNQQEIQAAIQTMKSGSSREKQQMISTLYQMFSAATTPPAQPAQPASAPAAQPAPATKPAFNGWSAK